MKHFYSIYDYEGEIISLGVNVHSENLVKMYQKGQQTNKTAKSVEKSTKPVELV